MRTTNPFHELYVGERISSAEFVRIFSHDLVELASPLFLPGNVVLAGVQGSGKSMLFKLLRPEIRQEYATAGLPFPVPKQMQRFIAAGINLNTSEATHFGLRSDPADSTARGLLFGDFFNHSIVLDLLKTVQTLAFGEPTVASELGILLDDGRARDLAVLLSSDPCWHGALSGVSTLEELRARIQRRLIHYVSFMHDNIPALDAYVTSSKTAVGSPISAAARILKDVGIVPHDVNIFVHVDQYEEIGTIRSGGDEPNYQSVVNRALNRRDPAVSYRIGTRAYAWHEQATIFGTTAKLEQERDYKFVDLDEKLRRHEDRSTYVFPKFAKNVFARRLRAARVFSEQQDDDTLIHMVFGASNTAEEKARTYVGSKPERALKLPKGWPQHIRELLNGIAASDPLSARLGESWARQKGFDSLDQTPPPWQHEWWRKERVELALAQIASSTQQRQLWSGVDDIIDIADGNILGFLGICQQIWDLAVQMDGRRDQTPTFPVSVNVQSVGILNASEDWFEKIRQEFGNSDDRYKLVRYLGQRFSRQMLDDRKMSNPGHNGFSIADADLEQYPAVRALLIEASAYGNLAMLDHTTKERDRAPRTKFYVSKIFCPALRLPFNRVKEPVYVKAADAEGWMMEAGIIKHDGRRVPRTRMPTEVPLLDLIEPNE